MELRIAIGVAVIAGLVILLLSVSSLISSYLVHRPAKGLEPAPLLGSIGRVQLPIPAGGVGAVALVGTGTRVTVPARSGAPLPRGAQVVVTDVDGKVIVVEFLAMEEESWRS